MPSGITVETAKTIFWIIWAAAAVVWIVSALWIGTWFRKKTYGRTDDPFEDPLSADGPEHVDLEGQTTVALAPDEVSRRLTCFFANHLAAGLTVEESSPTRVRLSGGGTGSATAGRQGQMPLDEVTFTFHSFAGAAAEVRYSARLTRLKRFCRIGAGVFQILGLAALGAACYVMLTFVVTSPKIGIRYQVWQTLQLVHFLWPPFLFAGVYAMTRRSIARLIGTLLGNLAYQTADTQGPTTMSLSDGLSG